MLSILEFLFIKLLITLVWEILREDWNRKKLQPCVLLAQHRTRR